MPARGALKPKLVKVAEMKTIFVNEKDADRRWYLIDAADKPVGRVAAKVASLLRGKHKAAFAPNQECGDYVVVVNAGKAAMTGAKPENKMYHHHTGFPGGLRSVNYQKLLQRHPESPLLLAVKGMLPKGRLGRKLLSNVKIYAGAEHPHAAQNPVTMEI